MQIKPIIAAAGALACLISGWAAVAANVPNATGAALNREGRKAKAGEILTLAAMSEDKTDAKAGQAGPAGQNMANGGKVPAIKSVRNTRPKRDRHKDARACLDKTDNKAIIKCAHKYR
jgi:hypothetical protein